VRYAASFSSLVNKIGSSNGRTRVVPKRGEELEEGIDPACSDSNSAKLSDVDADNCFLIGVLSVFVSVSAIPCRVPTDKRAAIDSGEPRPVLLCIF
jgi:hypothetical protein